MDRPTRPKKTTPFRRCARRSRLQSTRRVLFVVPRFQSSLAGEIRALDGNAYEVSIFAQTSGLGEHHGLIDPSIFGSDPATRAIDDVAPDLIPLREGGALTKPAAKHARRQGIRMLGYSLLPADRRLPRKTRLRLFLSEIPSERVTRQNGAVTILCIGNLCRNGKSGQVDRRLGHDPGRTALAPDAGRIGYARRKRRL